MGFGGFVDPKERAAAEQAAEAIESARARADAHTEALATAIVEGFGLVANAILTASGRAPAISGIPGPALIEPAFNPGSDIGEDEDPVGDLLGDDEDSR